mmetsp:Transcript_67290/g.186440  ORF Transcript_67290/g.186440 Transcript_67290/m.186440 type:complete len:579 (-) Transcript_67290:192-1928(-)
MSLSSSVAVTSVVPDMPQGWDRTTAPGWGLDGAKLHGMGSEKGVPVQSWCVTREDLVFLRDDIKRAIASGEIAPTERDPFDPKDDVVGPNMYTCCDQYIKPLTKRAGSMSWALLRHPDGLECDLFVTHAWIEGIFEFVDKVLNSWPRGKRSCYICMLANPQNLDISALIKSPRESPFALCLECASHMLVIPNHYSSIYSRLWCVYEAFLAYKLEKTIITASAPVLRKTLMCLSLQAVIFTVAVSVVGPDPAWTSDECNTVPWLPVLMVGAPLTKLLAYIHGPRFTGTFAKWFLTFPLLFVLDSFGIALSGIVLAAEAAQLTVDCSEPQWPANGACAMAITFSCFFLASEVDRVRAIQARDEADELRKSFTTVSNAECSNAADKEHILLEVQKDMSGVDEAVHVLLAAGMSTPALRKAASRGTDVSDAAHMSASNFTFCSGFWVVMQVVFLSIRGHTPIILVCWIILSLAILATGFLGLWFTSQDKRAFSIAATAKVMMFAALALRFGTVDPGSLSEPAMSAIVGGILVSSSIISLMLSYGGMARIAAIPTIGPWFAALLGPKTACCCCFMSSSVRSAA